MDKNKKLIILISSIMAGILIMAGVLSIIINQKNKAMKRNGVDVVIYQHHVLNYHFDPTKGRTEVYRAKFTNELTYDAYIYALDNATLYNYIVIANGTIQVKSSNCTNHICQNTRLTTSDGLLNSISISCLPNGLEIVLEESK